MRAERYACLLPGPNRSSSTRIGASARPGSAGRLGDQQIYLPGGAFSTGDQVVIKLNDSRLSVRNSDRGVIVDVDLAARGLDLRLSNATVRLHGRSSSKRPRALIRRSCTDMPSRRTSRRA
jgi:hypothetical protein